ncbi:MAG TPA: PfkB family carbohydrate kinase [Propionicimonas sp.]|jgi:sugar/nucleoside kinase (ribokinase family)
MMDALRFAPVLVVGDVMLDYTLELAEGEHDEKRHVAASATAVGGTGANTAAALVLLGVPVVLAGTVGDDCAGRTCLSQLGDLGVDVSRVQVLPGTTGRATIVIDGERRHVYVDRGVCDSPVRDLPRTPLTYVSLPAAVDPSELHDGHVVLGIEHQMVSPSLDPLLSLAAVVVTNELGASRLQPSLTPAEVVVTRGGQGAEVRSGDRAPVEVAGSRVEVVDATGAGDAFAAGLIAALAAGAPIAAAAAFGNRMGAVAVGQRGAMLRAIPQDVAPAFDAVLGTYGEDEL